MRHSSNLFDLHHRNNNNVAFVPNEDSDQLATLSDQNLHCPHKEILGPKLFCKYTVMTDF